MRYLIPSLTVKIVFLSLLVNCSPAPQTPRLESLDELELADNEIAVGIASNGNEAMTEYVASLVGDYGAAGIVLVLDESIAQRRVAVSATCPEGQTALYNDRSKDWECEAPIMEPVTVSAQLSDSDYENPTDDEDYAELSEGADDDDLSEDGSLALKKRKVKISVKKKAKAKSKPKNTSGSAVNPNSKLGNKDKQFEKDSFKSYKTFKGQPASAELPISYMKNSNVLGQKKLYRGVKDLNGISGGNRDKYVDDAFRKGIPSNYRLDANVPGVKNPKEGPKTNVWEHMNKSAENSVFVPTTKKMSVATQFAKGSSGGVFVIRPKDSVVIDVNKTVGKTGNPDFYKQKEYVFANEIRGPEITHFLTIDNKGKVVNKIKNPYIEK